MEKQNKKVVMSVMFEVDSERGLQDISTYLINKIEEAAKDALPEWAAIEDVRVLIGNEA